MTLHSLNKRGGSTYWWYLSIPNERLGRAHLLHVPTFTVDPSLLFYPGWMSHESRVRTRERYEQCPIIVPRYITPDTDMYDRHCSTRQRARRYMSTDDIIEQRNGVCDACLLFRQAYPEQVGESIAGQRFADIRQWADRYRVVQHDHAINVQNIRFDNKAEWLDTVQRAVYGI